MSVRNAALSKNTGVYETDYTKGVGRCYRALAAFTPPSVPNAIWQTPHESMVAFISTSQTPRHCARLTVGNADVNSRSDTRRFWRWCNPGHKLRTRWWWILPSRSGHIHVWGKAAVAIRPKIRNNISKKTTSFLLSPFNFTIHKLPPNR
jgi:hypothetical protein